MQRYPASRVAPMSLLVPVVGITAAWLFLGEQPTYVEIGGAALVIAGCAAGALAAPRSRAHTTPPPVFSHSHGDSAAKDQVGVGSAAEND